MDRLVSMAAARPVPIGQTIVAISQLARRRHVSPKPRSDVRSRHEHVRAEPVVESSFAQSSAVRHRDRRLFNAACARETFSRMSEAFAVQINGLGLALCLSIN